MREVKIYRAESIGNTNETNTLTENYEQTREIHMQTHVEKKEKFWKKI